jgi:hypothetical protein
VGGAGAGCDGGGALKWFNAPLASSDKRDDGGGDGDGDDDLDDDDGGACESVVGAMLFGTPLCKYLLSIMADDDKVLDAAPAAAAVVVDGRVSVVGWSSGLGRASCINSITKSNK